MIYTRKDNAPASTPVSNSLRAIRHVAPMLVLAAVSGFAAAAPVTDGIGDFLPTFTGTRGGDLDVKTAELRLDNGLFSLSTTLNGAIGTTPGTIYVLGLDRGMGTARFGSTFAPGILFDEVIIVPSVGAASIRDFINNKTYALASDAVSMVGDTLRFSFSTDVATSEGFKPADYTWDFWPRNGLGSNAQISDFAPDAMNARVTSSNVPEPATLALFGFGFLGLLFARKRMKV